MQRIAARHAVPSAAAVRSALISHSDVSEPHDRQSEHLGMSEPNTFPIPFKSLRTLSGGNGGSYIVGAMFTAAFLSKAERLAASCARHGLSYTLHEVPTVHRSISSHGTDDPTYTKANFIHFLLTAHRKPVLYVDADCEFSSAPELIEALARSRCDFAIYNWFADRYTDSFIPIELDSSASAPLAKRRYYRFLARGEAFFTNAQLKCSGLVQFYRNSLAARGLLARWYRTIVTFPGCADDAALNFTFNNLTRLSWLSWLLRVQWLPKSYARIAWWIYEEPVINHPELPTRSIWHAEIKDPQGRKEFYFSRMEPRKPVGLFPRGYIIDAEQRMLCKLEDGRVVPIGPIGKTLWL